MVNSAWGTTMRETLPNVDFESIPEGLAGLWVVLRLGVPQEIMGQGESPQEAVRKSRVDPNDPRFALTQVPETPSAAWLSRSTRSNL